MTEVLKNKSEKNAIVIAQFFNKLIKNKNEPIPTILNKEDQTKLNSFISVGEFPMRIKCATLPWITVESVIKNNTKEISIE
jgi:nitrogen fixation protein NifU and related proteins